MGVIWGKVMAGETPANPATLVVRFTDLTDMPMLAAHVPWVVCLLLV
jgi:hypothetical protein